MGTALKTTAKAETIAAAIYAATGIKADVIYSPGRPPRVTFTPENGRKMESFLSAQIKKKSDVEIDVLPIIQPAIIKNILPFILAGGAAVFVAGLLTGSAKAKRY